MGPVYPSELFGSAKMQAIAETFHLHFDFFIYDALALDHRRAYVSKEKVHPAITSLQNLNTITLRYVIIDIPKDATDSPYYHGETE